MKGCGLAERAARQALAPDRRRWPGALPYDMLRHEQCPGAVVTQVGDKVGSPSALA